VGDQIEQYDALQFPFKADQHRLARLLIAGQAPGPLMAWAWIGREKTVDDLVDELMDALKLLLRADIDD